MRGRGGEGDVVGTLLSRGVVLLPLVVLLQALRSTLRYPAGVPFPILDMEDPAVYFHMDLATKVDGVFTVEVDSVVPAPEQGGAFAPLAALARNRSGWRRRGPGLGFLGFGSFSGEGIWCDCAGSRDSEHSARASGSTLLLLATSFWAVACSIELVYHARWKYQISCAFE